MTEPQGTQDALDAFAEAATSLQARVNLHIGWMTIYGLPVPPELCDVNAKLVDVARQLREVGQQGAKDTSADQGIRQAEWTVRREVATHGR